MKRFDVEEPQRFLIVRSQKHKSLLKITFISDTYISKTLFVLRVNAERIISLYNLLNCDMSVRESMCVAEHFSFCRSFPGCHRIPQTPKHLQFSAEWGSDHQHLSSSQTVGLQNEFIPHPKKTLSVSPS